GCGFAQVPGGRQPAPATPGDDHALVAALGQKISRGGYEGRLPECGQATNRRKASCSGNHLATRQCHDYSSLKDAAAGSADIVRHADARAVTASSMSASVVCRPSERRTAPNALAGAMPIAVSVAEGSSLAVWQAEPVDAS